MFALEFAWDHGTNQKRLSYQQNATLFIHTTKWSTDKILSPNRHRIEYGNRLRTTIQYIYYSQAECVPMWFRLYWLKCRRRLPFAFLRITNVGTFWSPIAVIQYRGILRCALTYLCILCVFIYICYCICQYNHEFRLQKCTYWLNQFNLMSFGEK